MDIEKTLKNAGLRTTRQRRVILELLLACGSPLSHAEILSKIEEHLDRVTLYRTLETLRKAGVDMEDPETVEECLRTFEETLAQLEKLMEE